MYENISIDNYKSDYEDKDNHQLIDVREEDEYEAGHLPGAINIPMSEFQARQSEIDMSQTLILVCATGGRSGMAADYMNAIGHHDVYNLLDGTKGWIKRGLPVETED
jgi:rhodanese-related sulfurtransferase